MLHDRGQGAGGLSDVDVNVLRSEQAFTRYLCACVIGHLEVVRCAQSHGELRGTSLFGQGVPAPCDSPSLDSCNRNGRSDPKPLYVLETSRQIHYLSSARVQTP